METHQANKTGAEEVSVSLLFSDLCDGIPFWNKHDLLLDPPKISSCFLDTVLVWGPCGFLWITSPFLVISLMTNNERALPLSKLSVAKSTVSLCILLTLLVELLIEGVEPTCTGRTLLTKGHIVAIAVKSVTMVLTIILQQLQRQKGVNASGIQFVFWNLAVLCEIPSLYSHLTEQTFCAADIVYYIYYLLQVIQLIFHFFVESKIAKGYKEFGEENVCPEMTVSFLNRITFRWMNDIIGLCSTGKFSETDLWDLEPKMKCDLLTAELEAAWENEKRNCLSANMKSVARKHGMRNCYNRKVDEFILKEKNGTGAQQYGSTTENYKRKQHKVSRSPNLLKTLFLCFGLEYAQGVVLLTMSGLAVILEPLIIREIIYSIERRGQPDNVEWLGYVYAVLLFAVGTFESNLYQNTLHNLTTLGIKVKSALIGTIYKKVLSMNKYSADAVSVGEVINLMSVDVLRIQDSCNRSTQLPMTIGVVITGLVELYIIMGTSFVGGIAVVVFILIVTIYLSSRIGWHHKSVLDLKSTRYKLLQEVLSGIKVLKMYAWEIPFLNKLKAIRAQEINLLQKSTLLTSVVFAMAIETPQIINLVILIWFVCMSSASVLDADMVMTSLTIVNIIRFAVIVGPVACFSSIQGFVSVKRIEDFLKCTDRTVDAVSFLPKSSLAVEIQNGSFAWNLNIPRPVLSNIQFTVRKGELIALVGPVGCGKSSLISTIMGDLETLSGRVYVGEGSIAYVPQEAWIQNMTLEDNILFGMPFHDKKYNTIIESCQLRSDLNMLPNGDQTEIGEKGINISGGQKQRVSLARAVYHDADHYLLDDPLSAVDAHIAKKLFKYVIGNEGLLKDKTRIIATHGVQWLPMMDRILVMDDGIITETGTFAELTGHNGPFAMFMKQHMHDRDKNDETDDDSDSDTFTKHTYYRQVEDTSSSECELSSEEFVSSVVTQRQQQHAIKEKQRQKIVNVCLNKGRLTSDEHTSTGGKVNMKALTSYLKTFGVLWGLASLVSWLVFQVLYNYGNVWLALWTEDPIFQNTEVAGEDETSRRNYYYLIVLCILTGSSCVAVFVAFHVVFSRVVSTSGILHDTMLVRVFRSPMSFFDTTPIGRIVTRLSSDIDILDVRMNDTLRPLKVTLSRIAVTYIIVSVTSPLFLVILIPLLCSWYIIMNYYTKSARQLSRIECIKKSPIVNHFSETISGGTVIRAYDCAERFIQEMKTRVDDNVKFFFAANTGARWTSLRVELTSILATFVVVVLSLATSYQDAAILGLCLSYFIQLPFLTNMMVFFTMEMETNFASVERVIQFSQLPSEAEWKIDENTPPNNWPQCGQILFKKYCTRYREGLELVLRGITCTIAPGEKIGIVGRTGAGKSSLATSLFRLVEAAEGAIYIDNINIAHIGLHDLRSNITILPQDPVVFSGSLRDNIDPLQRFDDERIWRAITDAHLVDFVNELSDGLNFDVGENGQKLSVGQRQLLCLARSLLHKTRILVLDEATSSVDVGKDILLQETIKERFAECTVLTIAHRINTILHYDRIMVLDAGVIKEFDSPENLLNDQSSVFHSLAADAGII